jgi:transposase InsO family protein
MKALYQMVGLSKQALHKFNASQVRGLVRQERLEQQALAIRKMHPQMGCRSMYSLMKDIGWGRDRSEAFLLSHGFRIRRKPNYLKTTVSQRIYKFPNLIKGLKIRDINKVWQTDITYFTIPNEGVFYLIFIIDVYSRRIIGHTAHNHLRAEANLECLKMAFKTRKGQDLKNLIHHSDRGGQYIDKNYLEALRQRHIRISMCEQAWQNAYTERINGTIKNDYLEFRSIDSLTDLRKNLNHDIHLYNTERPHRNLLFKMSPIKFEEYLKNTPPRKRPIVSIHNHEED